MKYTLYSLTVVLIIALVAGAYVFILPEQIEATVPVFQYENHSRFDYTARQQASYIFGDLPLDAVLNEETPLPPPQSNSKYPSEFINFIEMTYTFQVASEVPLTIATDIKINALYSKDNKPQTVPVPAAVKQTGTVFTATFQVPLDIILGNTPTTIQAIAYSTIVAPGATPVFESFVQSLGCLISGPYLELSNKISSSSQSSFGSLLYGQSGVFDYTVYLSSASPFGAVALRAPQPPPEVAPEPPGLSAKAFKPEDTLFSALFDRLDATFNYSLTADGRLSQEAETVQVTAILGEPGVWSKTFVLVPLTDKSGSFSVSFSLTAEDLAGYIDVYEAVKQETNKTSPYALTIEAEVHLTGQTDFGSLDQTYKQQLSTKLGAATIDWNEKMEASEPGSISAARLVPNTIKYLGLSVSNARTGVLVAVGAIVALIGALLAYQTWLRPTPASAQSASIREFNQRFKSMLVEVVQPPPAAPGDIVIAASSLPDLVRMAYMLLKPVLVHAAPDGCYTYYVIDGTKRYQFEIGP